MLRRSSVAKLLLGVFVVYMLHTAWLLYGFLNTKPCYGGKGEPCITSYLAAKPRLQVSTEILSTYNRLNLALNHKMCKVMSPCFSRQVSVSLPEETQNNGSLYAVVYVHKAGISPLEDRREVHYAAHLTTYITPPRTKGQKKREPQRPVSHWRPHLSITVMSEEFSFSKAGLPSDVRRYMRISQEGRRMTYLPLLLVNELTCRVKDLMEINSSSSVQLPLTVSYEGISLRTFRFWIHLHDIVYSLRQFGFTEENIDEIKETLIGSNLYLLVLTLICEFLALKNDVCSWAKKKSMVGMSRKSVLWRCLGTLLIFLHLLEETSLLVLLPVGLGACVEVLAMTAASLISSQTNKLDEEERKTVEYDMQASRYLSYLVYPLCISGAVFSLGYICQKKIIPYVSVFPPGVYALGFLSMAPQLFINDKGVNTLISDLCACASFFSSSVPFTSSHQLSCFRDELLFLLYLFQRR
uniref:Lipid scramblase CLPTM1L n=1 Tax=Poecilia mexicana TaxID=48701 RepID=A0A3B3Y2X9_9TELE